MTSCCGAIHPFLWEKGEMIDLGTFGGNFAAATAMDDRGQVVGGSGTSGEVENRAFVWERGVMTDLGSARRFAEHRACDQ